MTRRERNRLFKRAGIQPSEARYDAEHGWLISASAVRKLCALEPNSYIAAALTRYAADIQRQRLRVIDGGGEQSEASPATDWLPSLGPQ
jgi:hypothetical protein